MGWRDASSVAALACSLAVGCASDPGPSADDAAPIQAADAAPADAGFDAAPSAFCVDEDRDDDYAAGMSKVGDNGWTIALLDSVPGPPERGDSAWTLEVRDPSSTPRDDVEIEVFPFMPDHGHGTPVMAVVTPTGSDGTYEVAPVNLYMPGLWSIRLTLRDPAGDAQLDRVSYRFCVEL